MAQFKAHIDIMPLEALLDPQGKAVSASMKNIGLADVSNVRIGKHITLHIEADNEKQAESHADEACKKLLCNQIMEYYSVRIDAI